MSLTKEQVEDYKAKLQKKRQSIVNALQDSAVEGMWSQVVDKYSDQAHFLYEIIQNADDALATHARFILKDEELVFIHNGTRFFSISDVNSEREDKLAGKLGDINAITSVGQSNKIDSSKIGKFGMGFKSVFQYTCTPFIYDSNFRFKITDYMVPNWLDEDYPERNPDETVFVFPFNRSDITSAEAKNDILEKLKNLVMPVLFLRTLDKIEYECDGIKGVYAKKSLESISFDATTAIKYQIVNNDENYLLWLFSRIDGNNLKYSVGYFIDKDDKLIPQPNLTAFCFFPTKVNTNLNFIVHAPFLLTDSREGIKAKCNHNIMLVQNLADLAADALNYFVEIGKNKSLRLIDDDIIKIIPIKKSIFDIVSTDAISFEPFYTKIQKKMAEGLLPSEEGNVSVTKACWADTRNLKDLFSSSQLKSLLFVSRWDSSSYSYKKFYEEREWVFISLGKRNNPDLAAYLKEIHVPDYSIDDLLSKMTANFIESQSVEWLCQMYGLIATNSDSLRKARTASIFLNEQRKASAAFVGNTANLFLNSPNSSGYNVVLKDIENDENGRNLLTKMAVSQPVLKNKIEQKILTKSEFDEINDFKDLLDYYIECENKGFNDEKKSFVDKIVDKKFLAVMNVDGEDRGMASPDSCVHFLTEELKIYFSSSKEILFVNISKYEQNLTVNEQKYLSSFLHSLGVSDFAINAITDINCSDYPGKVARSTGYQKFKKYYLLGAYDFLNVVLEQKNVEYSKILIRQMSHAYEVSENYYPDCLFGYQYEYFYRRHCTAKAKDDKVNQFKTEKWLLDNDGNWVSPQETFLQRLSDNYNISDSDIKSFLSNYLGIQKEHAEYDALGEDIRKKVELSDLLEKHGLEDISDEEMQMIKQWREKKQEQENSGKEITGESNGKTTNNHGENSEGRENNNPTPETPETPTKKISREIVDIANEKKKAGKAQSSNSEKKNENEDDEDEDEFTKASVDYTKKIQKAKDKCAVEINALEEFETAQKLAIESKRYSYQWFSSLLKLEMLSSNENNSNSREVSISFGKVEKDSSSRKTLILKQPNKNIPSSIEDLYGVNLTLRMTDGSVKNLPFEAASIRSFTLRVMLMHADQLDGLDLTKVLSASIVAKSPVFLLQELQKQFDILGYESDFDMKTSLCENIKFVFGPPGTGKTTFLARNVLKQLVEENEHVKILVLTPTNKAADVIVNRTVDIMAGDDSYKNWLVRFGVTNDETIEENGLFYSKNYDIEKTAKSVVVTTIARYPYDCMKSEGKEDKNLRDIEWDYIIVDEASMIPLIQMVYLLYSQKPKQFIIAGDPFQIEPTSSVNLWKDENVYKMVKLNSFTDIHTEPHNFEVELLKTQYRSIPSIGKIFSSLTYDDSLAHNRHEESQRALNIENFITYSSLNLVKFPVHRYESIYRSKKLNKSNYHIYSALFAYEFTCYLARKIAEKNPSEHFRIGVISPYSAQAKLINNLLLAEKLPDSISTLCGTIHGFQGDECDVLLTVFNAPEGISDSEKMFLNHKNIVNVAISRAKDYLFVLMPDNNTEKIENLKLVNRVESLMKENPSCTEIGSHELEEVMFGSKLYLEENTFSTGHQSVNVYGLPEKIYEVRSEDDAIDIQLHKS